MAVACEEFLAELSTRARDLVQDCYEYHSSFSIKSHVWMSSSSENALQQETATKSFCRVKQNPSINKFNQKTIVPAFNRKDCCCWKCSSFIARLLTVTAKTLRDWRARVRFVYQGYRVKVKVTRAKRVEEKACVFCLRVVQLRLKSYLVNHSLYFVTK